MVSALADQPILDQLLQKAKEGPIIGYFGYGSLVNEKTLRTEYILSMPAELKGWYRAWDIPDGLDFNAQSVSLLTARKQDDHAIKGALVFDWAYHLPNVDAREHHYHRHLLTPEDLALPDQWQALECNFYVYEAIKNKHPNRTKRPPILQSYLDAVLQGFLNLYGQMGVERFVSETKNFDTPILRDREAPKYPRSIDLSPSERNLIDYILTKQQDITFI